MAMPAFCFVDTTKPRTGFRRDALWQQFRDLHRVQRRPLQQLIRGDEQRD
jgi:hypothetical protein